MHSDSFNQMQILSFLPLNQNSGGKFTDELMCKSCFLVTLLQAAHALTLSWCQRRTTKWNTALTCVTFWILLGLNRVSTELNKLWQRLSCFEAEMFLSFQSAVSEYCSDPLNERRFLFSYKNWSLNSFVLWSPSREAWEGRFYKVLGIFHRFYKKRCWKGEWFSLFSNEGATVQ